jgi:hypothetical protein
MFGLELFSLKEHFLKSGVEWGGTMDIKPTTNKLLFCSSLTKICLAYSDYTQNAFVFEYHSEFEFILGNTSE